MGFFAQFGGGVGNGMDGIALFYMHSLADRNIFAGYLWLGTLGTG